MFRLLKPSALLALMISISVLPGTAYAETSGGDSTGGAPPASGVLSASGVPSAEGRSAQWMSNGGGSVYLHRSADWHRQEAAQGAGPYAFARTRNLVYHNGPIMQNVKAYTIFWIPTGKTVASGYQTLLNRYFTDINATSFYNINTQYYQGSTTKTYMQNSSVLLTTWTDTAAYPRAGSASNPLLDSDIRAEVAHAIQVNGWTVDQSSTFFVYTASGIESCYDSVDCTPGTSHPVYCAYHGNFALSGANVLYANMPYAETWGASCRSFTNSPNANIAADSEISISSHEHFESATDPNGTAWYDSVGYEDGDKCAYNYGTVAANGSNMTLNGHPYIIQREWRNDTSACAISR